MSSDAAGGLGPFSAGQPFGPAIQGLAPGAPGQAAAQLPTMTGAPASGDEATQPPGQSTTPGRQQSAPTITAPKGGGAIRGIAEKFAVNPATGTASLSVPVPATGGRPGAGPALSLSYDSGSGNGVFGFGWQLSVPAITRKTDKGIPRYDDAEESDVFILSGAEDLVPILDGGRPRQIRRRVGATQWLVKTYRPRVEGLFARIERWTNQATGEIHWRSITKDNITSLFGPDDNSRIFDPEPGAGDRRVFSWLLAETYDDKGNVTRYRYKAEDVVGVGLGSLHERNRSDWSRTANRHLKSVRYGNSVSRLVERETPDRAWMFEVVLDYGEHDLANPTPAECQPWACRRDPFSTHRAGFEIRTYRLCQRLLIFHHFPDEPEIGANCLVRSLDLSYRQDPGHKSKSGSSLGTYLNSVTSKGWRRLRDGGYLTRSMPPLELTYSQTIIDDDVKVLDPGSSRELTPVVDGTTWQWVDLDGAGIPGALSEQAGCWYYKSNLGRGRLAASQPLRSLPSLAVSGGSQQLLDLAGEGRLDLVQFTAPTPGFAARTADESWAQFTPFPSLPTIDWADPNLRCADVDGHGLPDLLITGDDVIGWCLSLGRAGWTEARRVGMPLDETSGPRLVFSNGDQNVFLADMSGDGLSDIVRIRNGQICYWPNLGRGRFGRRVEMDDPPFFDEADLFDPARIRLADVDGSGTTDIVYLGRYCASVHLNQSGNSWAPPRLIRSFPRMDDLTQVSVTDLLGTGTACLVWSSPLPEDSCRPIRYLDLTGGRKPHLLIRAVNNLGAETRISYAASTHFYLQDKAAGNPWITCLPFPVQVVERVETWDAVGRNLFASRYAYHHGYYDGVEREFRGFGMVEKWDTEDYATLAAAGRAAGDREAATNLDPAANVPPVLTRTWYHTGADTSVGPLSRQLAREYFTPESRAGRRLPSQQVPTDLPGEERREAWRALKGTMLRQEVYGKDGVPRSAIPYTAAEHSYHVTMLQPRGPNRHAVFFVYPEQTLTHQYERRVKDPRVQHQLVLEVDDFGDVLLAAAIGYGRRRPAQGTGDRTEQTRPLATVAENSYTNFIDQPDAFLGRMQAESRNYELTGLHPAPGSPLSIGQARAAIADAAPLRFEQRPDGGLQKRLIDHQRTLYRKDDLSGPLPLGRVESLALPYHSQHLAFTAGLVGEIYGDRLNPQILEREGGYVRDPADDSWWAPSARLYYSPEPCDPAEELAFARRHFFLARRSVDPFGHTTTVRYDPYDLLPIQSRDAVGNKVTAGERDAEGVLVTNGNDYRVLEPCLIMDANRNRSAVAFDALGMVAGTAVMGKPGERVGDSLDGFVADLPDDHLAAYLEDPSASAHRVLGRATTRVVQDLHAWRRTGLHPVVVGTLARETHESDLAPGARTAIQLAFSYSDGFGREIQKKAQAEPGPVTEDGPVLRRRWIGSGWTIFNNKGMPVRKYEPFFSATHAFEFAQTVGVSAIVFYDPVGRVVAAVYPDHTYDKTVFDAWQQAQWDVTDTVLVANPADDPDVGGFLTGLARSAYLPTWYQRRAHGGLGRLEQEAAAKAAASAETPSVAHFDTLGRTFLTRVTNRYLRDSTQVEEELTTRIILDIKGNRRQVHDTLHRLAARFDYDVLGNAIRQQSMEAGERSMLGDVIGKPIYGWNSREIVLRTTYDPLRRPTAVYVREEAGPEWVAERAVYGEAARDAERLNLRAAEHRHYDNGGVVTSEAYDFKGNLMRSTRRLATQYRAPVNWSRQTELEQRTYLVRTCYDALNRPVEQVLPDATVLRPVYNEAKLLDRLNVDLRGAGTFIPMVRHLEYNARGQRTFIAYGNGASSRFSYDPLTFRLTRLFSAGEAEGAGGPGHRGRSRGARGSDGTRGSGDPGGERGAAGPRLQDLQYTYDPSGNVTSVSDRAQQRLFFRNKVVEPGADYTYDALYRLIEATGREHLGLLASGQPAPPVPTSRTDAPRVAVPARGDGQAMARYVERYDYDEAGNLVRVVHRGADQALPGWTRHYSYREPSQLEPVKASNRLSYTRVGQHAAEEYSYDAHGNLTGMTQLEVMGWDYMDRLKLTAPEARGGGQPERTWYLYDAGGLRVRKTTEGPGNGGKPTRRSERLYIGMLEIYRRYSSDGKTVKLELETLTVRDDAARVALAETRVTGRGPGPAQLIKYQLGNLQGSAVLEVDERARIISYEEYYPYGCTSYQAVRNSVGAPKRYRFTGKERDSESGLYYNDARYYIPWLGRWASTDPSGLGDSDNLYEYVRGNPVRTTDPSGRQGDDAGTSQGGEAEKTYPACADELDAGAGDCPSVVGARYPDTVDAVGDPAWTVTEEQRTAERRPYATAGAAPPDLAEQGYVLAGPGTKELDWATEESKVGIVAGTYDATLGTFVEPFLPPGSDAEASVKSLRPKTNSPISQYVAHQTAVVVSAVVGAVTDAVASGVTGEGAAVEAQMGSGAGAPVAEPRFQIGVSNGRPVVSLPELNIELGPSPSIWNDIHPSTLPSPEAVEMSGVTGLASKTWAVTPGGPTTMSGWGQGSHIPGYGIPGPDVYNYSLGVGHPQLPHFFDYRGAAGRVAGSYGATHAERTALFLNPGADSVTVSQPPCCGCQMWLRQEAALRGRAIRVHTPSASFVYAPDGSTWRTIGPLRVPLQ
jgi:RHS repeat-associated protein